MSGWKERQVPDRPHHPVLTPPEYPELTPADEALIAVERQKIKDLFARLSSRRQAPTAAPTPLRSILPPIDPAVRADLERRAKLSDRKEPPDLRHRVERIGRPTVTPADDDW
jgi:hypothetical protein